MIFILQNEGAEILALEDEIERLRQLLGSTEP